MEGTFRRTGPDRHEVQVKKGERTVVGGDGRLITLKKGSRWMEGPDSRAVEIPSGWSYDISVAGRVYAVPPLGKTIRNSDGTLTVVAQGETTHRDKHGIHHIVSENAVVVEGAGGELSFYSFE